MIDEESLVGADQDESTPGYLNTMFKYRQAFIVDVRIDFRDAVEPHRKKKNCGRMSNSADVVIAIMQPCQPISSTYLRRSGAPAKTGTLLLHGTAERGQRGTVTQRYGGIVQKRRRSLRDVRYLRTPKAGPLKHGIIPLTVLNDTIRWKREIVSEKSMTPSLALH